MTTKDKMNNNKNKKTKPLTEKNLQSMPVAVVGISSIFPGSSNVTGFWNDITKGTDLITEVPPTHWIIDDYYDPDPTAPDKTYSKRGAFISSVDFDPMEYGIPPSNLATTDTSQLLALVVAKQVLEDASQGQFKNMNKDKISVILGVAAGLELLEEMSCRLGRPAWVKSLREEGLPESQVQKICDSIAANYTVWKESTFPGLLGNVVAGRIANQFDLKGTNCTVDAACGSSFASMSMVLNELYLGQSDLVITGGVDTTNDPFLYTCFSKTPALSLSDDCRPFSDKADGILLGEGIGMVAMKRLEDAERDGDKIYAVIKGMGTSSDGSGTSVYAPVPKGQARALRRCYENAGYGPETVELIEAHGTGTVAGDYAEFKGLDLVFGETDRDEKQWCALGTVKSQIGHTKSAAASAGLLKAIMSVHHRVLPPTIKVDKPDPRFDIEKTSFYLNTETRPWIRGNSYPRRASVSSFGFGGTNFHVAVEEYKGTGKNANRLRIFPTELLLYSANDEKTLLDRLRSVLADLETKDMFLYLTKKSQKNFDPKLKSRIAFVISDENDLKEKIGKAIELINKKPEESFTLPNSIYYNFGGIDTGKIAFLFPGQGSQYVGMSDDLAMNFNEACEVWDASANINMDDNYSLHDVVFPKPVFSDEEREEQNLKLKGTEWAQPALSTASLSMLSLIDKLGIKPHCVGGHSLGEITALYKAGIVDEVDLIKIARKRGELMADASSIDGAMSAVIGTFEEIEALLNKWKREVVIANHNSPRQVVISGATSEIEEVEKLLGAEGMKFTRLPVSTAFHSPLMTESCNKFQKFLKGIKFNKPNIPIFSNVEAAEYPKNIDDIKAILTKQINSPVWFVEELEAMYKSGVRTFVEIGPGSVLTKLAGQCFEGKEHVAVNIDKKGMHGVTAFWNGLAQLAVNGISMDLMSLWDVYLEPEDAREKEKPKIIVPLLGSNYNRPYPPAAGPESLPKPNPEKPVFENTGAIKEEQENINPITTASVKSTGTKQNQAAGQTHKTAPAFVQNQQPNYQDNRKMTSKKFTSQKPPVFSGGKNVYGNELIAAFQETQKQSADAYSVYQNTMAESHMSFLKSVEAANNTLGSILSGQPVRQQSSVVQQTYQQQIPVQKQPVQHKPVQNQPVRQQPVPQTPVNNKPVVETQQTAAVTKPDIKAEPAVKHEAAPVKSVDYNALLFKVVSEKTGYPVDILTMEMGLESDLGIDSIKRVEILAGVKDEAPWIPEVDASEMGNINTLGDVLDFIKKYETSSPVETAPVEKAAPVVITDAAAQAKSVDYNELLFRVVSEKTGYPVDILNLEMGLESDLGIDSIKRVEILAGIKDEATWIPEVDASQMGNINTLGDVLDFIKQHESATDAETGTVKEASLSPQQTSERSIDYKELLFRVVSEKTGYPVDILNLEMGLESDLGIDSIKRVEILAGIKDEAAWLPDVDASVMSEIRTIGDVLSFIEGFKSGKEKGVESVTDSAVIIETKDLESSESDKIGRYSLRAVEAAHTGFTMKGLVSMGPVIITDDGTGVAASLAEKLKGRGIDAVVTDDIPEDTGVLIFLNGLGKLKDEDSAISVNKKAFLAAKKIGKQFTLKGGVFVTVQDTGADFGLSGRGGVRVYSAGLSGLIKTAALEWPGASLKAIDLERGKRTADELAGELIKELFTGGPELEVGINRKGKRVRLESYISKIDTMDPVVDKNSVLVASGGARGVTAATLIELARQYQPGIVLLGRTELIDEPESCINAETDAELKSILMKETQAQGRKIVPAELGKMTRTILACREVKSTIKAIEDAGSRVKYIAVDVQDSAALNKSLEAVRNEMGPVTGIIHGAGVLQDKLITDKTEEQFDQVFNTKVNGMRALLKATEKDPVSVICMFSSIAARFGNTGQSDYSMANEVLNKIAGARAKKMKGKCSVKSMNWGPWDGGMVSPQLKEHFKSMGIPLIPMDLGASILVDEIQEGVTNNVEIVIGPAPPNAIFQKSKDGLELKVLVNRLDYPFINHHRIGDVPVVPVVMVVEWFTRAAMICRPDLRIVACKDVRVLRGIRLEKFQNGGDRLILSCRQATKEKNVAFEMELKGIEGPPYYKAVVEMAENANYENRASVNRIDKDLNSWSIDISEIYNKQLFHGPDFQVIKSLKGVSDKAASAVLAGTEKMNWDANSWNMDIAAIDGGLQLAILWGSEQLGRQSLPTKIGSYISHHEGPFKGEIHCELQGEVSGDSRTVSNIQFFNDEDKLVAEMCDVEMHMLKN